MLPVQILDFDSEIFDFKVAKITSSKLNVDELNNILSELVQKEVTLVYWLVDDNDHLSNEAAKMCHGFLGSKQVTFVTNLKELSLEQDQAADFLSEVKEYQATVPNHDLEQLAFQAGTYSHFHLDPRFPEKLFIKLYKKWIANSANGTVAKKILIISKNNRIVAMITLGEKNKRGDIGLLAVANGFRGQKLGTKLVMAAQQYFINHGYLISQVVTQEANLMACALYEKCGYVKEKAENFYHFWL